MENKPKPMDKLNKLQESGTARRKKKVIHRTALTDDKKLQTTLKKLAVNTIPGIEEVQASLASNTFAITGHGETKNFTELMPNILNHLGNGYLMPYGDKKEDKPDGKKEEGDDEIPDLVENFDTYLNQDGTQS